ncbi:MAG TPA: hypothetical protein VMD55_03125, partial [Terracidiphilus sp.]|nr:hypothetical protein [Terracidiphilus sp.]
LLTTDGLTRYAEAKTIAMLIFSCTSLPDACQALIDRAKSLGAVDNVTCLLLQFLPAEEIRAEETPAVEAPAVAEIAEESIAAEPGEAAASAEPVPAEEPEAEVKPAEELPAPAIEAVEKAFADMLAEDTAGAAGAPEQGEASQQE